MKGTQTQGHTPLPWGRSKAQWFTIVYPSESQNARCVVAHVHSDNVGNVPIAVAEANRDLIIRAVNSHADLLAAAKAALAATMPDTYIIQDGKVRLVCDILEAAIRAAEGGR